MTQVTTPEPPFFVDSDYQNISDDYAYLRADFMPTWVAVLVTNITVVSFKQFVI